MRHRKNILITGGSGLLALNWAALIRDTWNVTLVTHRKGVRLEGVKTCVLDFEDPYRLATQFELHAPDLIVHTAGLTSVDQCERFPELAHHANAQIALHVAQAAAARGVALIHISTDHLFEGTRSLYQESDPPQPLNAYGRSKALAETWVQEACPNALLIRTNFFGWGHGYRQSFSDWIIDSLRLNRSLRLFSNVFFNPIIADLVALNAHEMLEKGATGIYHLVGDERLSKYEFALKLAAHFNLRVDLIVRDQLVMGEFVAARPCDMSLDNSKTRLLLGRGLGNVDDFLENLWTQEVQGRKLELRGAVKQHIEWKDL
jgi:dTDP-4-dehydrorhamnose reductase